MSTAMSLNPERRNEIVVLIHGLGRSSCSMLRAGFWFQKAGYRVAYISYPSRTISIAAAVKNHVAPSLEKLAHRTAPSKFHFVTHSLGGIIYRAWAAQSEADYPLGRSVLIAPPNNGSEIADRIRHWPIARALMGPVIQELGTDENSTPRSLGPAIGEVGVIMGDQAKLPFFRHWLGPQSDGVVTVAGGKIEGLKDFCVMPAGHALIMWRPRILKAAEHFIREGCFPASCHR
jgi:hypothetical protein